LAAAISRGGRPVSESEIPMLANTKCSPLDSENGTFSASSSRCAIAMTCSPSPRPSHTMQNSSPPKRASVSPGRMTGVV
jgi:hypothetical protein